MVTHCSALVKVGRGSLPSEQSQSVKAVSAALLVGIDEVRGHLLQVGLGPLAGGFVGAGLVLCRSALGSARCSHA